MKFNVVRNNLKDESLKRELEDVIGWKKVLPPLFTGRSGYVFLNLGEGENRSVETVKFKGLGYFNWERNFVQKPGSGVYDEHVGRKGIVAYELWVGGGGELIYRPFANKPFGGVLFEKAEKEFLVIEKLDKVGVRVMKPLMLVSYDDLLFEGKNLGLCVMSIEESLMNFRVAGEWFDVGFRGDVLELSDVYEGEIKDGDLRIVWGKIVQVMELVVLELKKLHEFGGGFEAHLQNFWVNLQINDLFVVDLDKLEFFDEICEQKKYSLIYRDLISFISSFVYYFWGSDVWKMVEKTDLSSKEVFLVTCEILLGKYFDQEVELLNVNGVLENLSFGPEFLVGVKNGLMLDVAEILVKRFGGSVGADFVKKVEQLICSQKELSKGF